MTSTVLDTCYDRFMRPTSCRRGGRTGPWPSRAAATLLAGLLGILVLLGACSSNSDAPADAGGGTNSGGASDSGATPAAGPSGELPPERPPLTDQQPDYPAPEALPPLADPPVSPPPDAASEPEPISGNVSTTNDIALVRDPAVDLPPDDAPMLGDDDFDGPQPEPVITVPAGLDTDTNSPPDFVDFDNQIVLAGENFSLVVRPIDPDASFAGLFPVQLPTGSILEDNRDGTHTFRWRPLEPDVGVHALTITAVDPQVGTYRNQRTLYLKVELPDDPDDVVNLPPAINEIREHTVRVGDPVVMEVKGTDPNGTTPVLEVVEAPEGFTFEPHYRDEAIGVLRFMAAAPGPINVTMRATDERDDALSVDRSFTLQARDPGDFVLPGDRLRELTGENEPAFGYASLQGYYYRPDGAIYGELAAAEFERITTENGLKMSELNPRPGRYQWAEADNLVNFAERYEMEVHGHTLVWYFSVPGWLTRTPLADREMIMREHIDRVMSRYRGRIKVWDVVNEAIDVIKDPATGEDVEAILRPSVWQQAMGRDYIDIAFRQAHETDPDAVLLYNDFDTSFNALKADFQYQMMGELLEAGTPIDGIGFQMHLKSDFTDFESIAMNFRRMAELGLDIYVTELDVSMVEGTTFDQQAAVYEQVMRACILEPRCRAVTTWGFTDQYSWLRPTQPLLLDEAYQPKPAYTTVQQMLSGN